MRSTYVSFTRLFALTAIFVFAQACGEEEDSGQPLDASPLTSAEILSGHGGQAISLTDPIVDGKVRDPATGVIEDQYLLEGVIYTQDQLTGNFAGWLYRYETEDAIYLAFEQSVDINDNTYGVNSVEWPNAKRGHRFQDLDKSEHIKVQMYDATGTLKLDFFLDYVSLGRDGVVRSLGVSGGDGQMNVGNPAYVLGSSSSLLWNLTTGCPNACDVLPSGQVNNLFDSPPRVDEDGNVVNTYDEGTRQGTAPSEQGWIYPLVYEWKIDKAAFADSPFHSLVISEVHNSPVKTSNPVIIPQLRAKKLANPVSGSTVDVGETITYGIKIDNVSIGGFSNLVVTDVLDPNLDHAAAQVGFPETATFDLDGDGTIDPTPVACVPGGSYDEATHTVTFDPNLADPNIGYELPFGASMFVCFTAVVSPASKDPFPTVILNYGTVDANELPTPFDTNITEHIPLEAPVGAESITLMPTCGMDLDHSVEGATGIDGKPIENPVCAWTFTGPGGATGSSSACSGTFTAPVAGSWQANVVITDPDTGHNNAPGLTIGPLEVGASIVAAAQLSADCDGMLAYAGSYTGGLSSSTYSYAWIFTPSDANPNTSSDESGTFSGEPGTEYTASVVVTEHRGRLLCTDEAEASAVAPESIQAVAVLTPSCEQEFGYHVTATGPDGSPIVAPICAWTFDGGGTSDSCAGTHAASVGVAHGTVTVTDPVSQCSATFAASSVQVFAPLAAQGELMALCDSNIAFAGAHTGGSPAGVSYAWTFSPSDANPNSASVASGTFAGTPLTAYTGTLLVTDLRTDVADCHAAVTTEATVARASLSADVHLYPSCEQKFLYEASNLMGVDGESIADPQCLWTFSDGWTSTECEGAHTTDSAGSYTATLHLTDPATDCSVEYTGVGPVQVYAPLSVAASATAAICEPTFSYTAIPSGGSDPGNVTYGWTFAPSSADPASSSTQSGTATGVGQATYLATVTVTDPRTDIVCTATGSDEVTLNSVPTATASLIPACGLHFGYQLDSAIGSDGEPIATPECTWSFSDDSQALSCSGIQGVDEPGTYKGSVVVPDGFGCSATAVTNNVDVYPLLTVIAELEPTCSQSFSYDAQVLGGSPGAKTFSWALSPGEPSSSTSESGTRAGAADLLHTGTVTVSDTLPNGVVCTASDSDTAIPRAGIEVAITPDDLVATCPLATDAVTFTAVASGGSGNFTYAWTGAPCSGVSCTIDPSDSAFCDTHTLGLVLTDVEGLCPPQSADPVTFSKQTTITIVSP